MACWRWPGPATRDILALATKRVTNRRTDLAHDVVADSSDGTGERSLGESVKTIAIDDRRSVQADSDVIDIDLCGKSTDRSGYFGDCDEFSDVEHLRSREHEDRSTLSTDVGQPQFSPIHDSPHVSTSLQNVSARSGRLR